MNKNKKILFIAPSAYPLGGVAVWLDYLIPGLEQHGWNVMLGLTSGRYHNVHDYCKAYPDIKNIIEIRNVTGSREGRINNLAYAISQHNPDLVVGVNIPDAYEAVNRLRINRCSTPKVVMAIHGLQPDLFDDMAEYRNVLDAIICTNKLTLQLAEKDSDIDSSRLFYAPYGVEPGKTDSGRMLTDGKFRIAWVGRLEQFQKHIWDIPEIINELVNRRVDFELLIVGAGPDESALVEKLEQEYLLEYVTFLGVIPPEEMQHKVYDSCDALLVTSYWETGPIIIWEAMTNGVPVVSSRYIGSGLEAGLVDGENCLLFDIGDCEAAAVQVQRLRELKLCQQLTAGGYKLVSTKYSKRASIQGWDMAFRKILNLSVCPAVLPGVIPPAGRLDRVLGTLMGDRVRRSFGISHQHATAGGEWPHSYGHRKIDDRDFWSRALGLDVRSSK